MRRKRDRDDLKARRIARQLNVPWEDVAAQGARFDATADFIGDMAKKYQGKFGQEWYDPVTITLALLSQIPADKFIRGVKAPDLPPVPQDNEQLKVRTNAIREIVIRLCAVNGKEYVTLPFLTMAFILVQDGVDSETALRDINRGVLSGALPRYP